MKDELLDTQQEQDEKGDQVEGENDRGRVLRVGPGEDCLLYTSGGFITLACLIAAMQYMLRPKDDKKKTEEVAK